ncbi:hypothetical protein PybrP1_004334 [[Pythium] brassicae (nom. inval.)]|nr:hypothetical protein PybrP1_004334 [[Pythium] brassicae (nom. inval.)]
MGMLAALLAKNWVVKTRHPFATLSEVLNPLLCILLFAALKTLEQDIDVPSGWSTTTANESDATPAHIGSNWNLFDKSDLFAAFNTSVGGTTTENATNAQNGSVLAMSSPLTALSLAAGLEVPKFYFVETTMSGLLLNLALQALLEGDHLEELSELDMLLCFVKLVMFGYTSTSAASLYAVPEECRGKVVPYKLAITPDTLYTRKYFAALLEQWYPRLPLVAPVLGISALQVASFRDSRVFFDNETALEQYMAGESYGLSLANPKIYAAIAFQEFPTQSSEIGDLRGHAIEYSLRLNSTYTDTNFPGSVPRTIGRRFNVEKLNKEVKPLPTFSYATRGFMTLQTAVSRFLNCLPVWDPSSEMTNGTCQIKESTMKEGDPELDKRLLGQLENDLVVSSVLAALRQVQQLARTSSASSVGSASFFLESLKSTLERVSISVESIPASSKARLLQSLRQAPQPYHGSAAFVSPVEGFHYAGFFYKIRVVFPVGFILSYLYSVSRVIVALLMEKETKARELMRILGVDESYILFAWFLTYLQLLLVASLLQTLGAQRVLFQNSDFTMLFLFFFTFALSSFGYGFLISSLFSRARAGSFVGMGLFFMMFFVSFGFSDGTGELQRTWACLLSPVALAQGISIVTTVETVGVGLNSENASEVIENFRFVSAIWMQTLDFFVYVLAGLYFERIVPREFGVAEKWYFCLTPKVEYGTSDERLQDRNDEEVSTEMKQQEVDGRAVVVVNLRKEFDVPGGKKVALKGLSLAFYEGQITCLLGHNGAGKTTLMSILTGMIPPSSGDAWICGYSVATAMNSEIEKKILEVGLTEKRRVQSHALSGGMKRKLSLAIAFLGESRVVFLDEPTSGMDPYSRRSTWELIQNNRRDRVLILTTHFMDEADILGDRIAIMAEGELRCVGSSLFLKNRFGVGYRLSFVQRAGESAARSALASAGTEKKLHVLILQHVPEARVDTEVGTELTFLLPFECTSRFPALFEAVEKDLEKLGVLSFAISITTLEEIFLRVAEVQLAALLWKRLLCAKRDRSMLFFSMILPIVIMFAGLSALKMSLFIRNDPKLLLTSEAQYDLGADTPVPFSCTPSSASRSTDPSCAALMTPQYFSGGALYSLEIEDVVFESATSPTVFGVAYTNPTIEPNDTTGYCLRFGELAFERGYGHHSVTAESTVPPVEGQNGGYVLHSSAADQVLAYNLMVNSSATHAAPTYKAMMDEAIHRFLLSRAQITLPSGSSAARAPNVTVRVATHPFPLSFKTRSIFNSFLSLPAVIFVVIAFTFVPAAMMPFLVKEKQSEQNAKHQQLLSGVSLAAYWLANFVFDTLLYLVPMGAAILLLRMYGVTSSLSAGSGGGKSCQGCTQDVPEAVLSLFFLFGGAIAPWTYLMSHIMKDPGACLLYTVMLNFFLGLLLMITSYSLDSLESTQEANSVLIFLWRCSPLFSLGNGLLRVIVADIEALYGLSRVAKSAFSAEVAGYEIAYLAIECPVFFVLVLAVDWVQTEDDEDVVKEAQRVARMQETPTFAGGGTDGNDVVQLLALQKTYPNGKRAVADLSFGLARGECFGFLGINGAGKTTTMKILTGDVLPSSGSAKLNGHDIRTQLAKFDALLELLTVREHLELYGRLKGFTSTVLRSEVDRLLHELQLTSFERKLAGCLSGGNKRKLSVAIAMIGSPDLLFLDEPSTGMDPHARRFMWDVILQVSVQSRQTTVMLTTHSMGECEALCSKVGIMMGGRLRCYGSIPHLKERFGDGFLLECKLQAPASEQVASLLQQVPTGATTSAALAARASALLRAATSRWLVKEELAFLLQHHAALGLRLERQLQLRPPSGRLLLYDTRDVADFKKDGWRWQKRKDQSGRVREDRAKLVINRQVIVLGTYVHSSDVATFHRRSYALRDADPHIVLVHYFDEANKTPAGAWVGVAAAPVTTPTSAKGLKRALPNAGAVAAAALAPQSPFKPTLPRADRLQEESVDTIMNDCFEMDFVQATRSQLDARLGAEFSHASPDFEMLRPNGMMLSDFNDELLYPADAPSPLAASAAADCALTQAAAVVTPALVSDFSPDWDFTDGGAKILICLASPLPESPLEAPTSIFVQFGILTRVPAEKISDTVVRCTAPPSNSTGSKEIYVCCSRDQLHPECMQLSSKRVFTYKSHQNAPSPAIAAGSRGRAAGVVQSLSNPSSLARSNDFLVHETSAGKRGRSPRFAEDADVADRRMRAIEASTLSSFVDTDLDERQCKIRVVERLSEFHHAIWTAAPPAGVHGTGATINISTHTKSPRELQAQQLLGANADDRKEVAVQFASATLDEAAATDLSSANMLGLDDSTIETLSDQALEQLSESLLERVVRQLVTVAHTSEELLEELNSLDEAGLSLLHYVSFYNYAQLVPLLLSHGAQINQQSTQGQSALHLAAGCGHADVVDVLVRSAADLFALDFDGFTAADRADKSDHVELAASLRRLMRHPEDAGGTGERIGGVEPDRDAFAMDIDFSGPAVDAVARASEYGAVEFGSPARSCGSPAEPCGGASTKSKNYIGENHEHNRKLLLGAFSTMSLHDKCALSLSISRDPSTQNSSRRRGSSVGDDGFEAPSGGGATRPLASVPAPPDWSDLACGYEATENDSLCDSDVKSVIADDEASLTKLEAAMELMGPEERQSLEDEVKLLQHNIRAWLLKRNCKSMREATKRLHEAARSIEDQQKLLEQQQEASERAAMAQSERSQRERAAVTVQAATRSMLARRSFLQTKNVAIRVQAATRGVLCRKHFARMKTHALASLVIQRNVREWWYKQPGAMKAAGKEAAGPPPRSECATIAEEAPRGDPEAEEKEEASPPPPPPSC